MGRRFRLGPRFALSSALFLGACSAPDLSLAATPADSRVFLDDVQISNPRTAPIPYYGTAKVEVIPLQARDGQELHEAQVRQLVLEPPLHPLFFPLDLAAELLLDLVGGRRGWTTVVELNERPEPVPDGVTPAGLDDLRNRARLEAIRR